MEDDRSPLAGEPDGSHRPARAVVEAQVAKIFLAKAFLDAPRLRRFLSYSVTQSLDGNTDRLKETGIGLAVFDRPEFDPATDAIVRNTAARLRRELAAYYETEGRDDAVVITIPKGRYAAHFTVRQAQAAPAGHDQRRWPWVAAVVVAMAVLLTVLLGLRLVNRRARPAVASAESRPRRLLAPATSEGRSAIRLSTPQPYGQLVMSPDGKKLYALSDPDARTIAVFGVADLQLQRAIALPAAAAVLRISRGGKWLFATTEAGRVVIRIDTGTGVVAEVARTGVPVLDIAPTADGAKVFLAMRYSGLKRINIQTGEATILSPIACPTSLKLDPSENFLYVGYECGGPHGRPGHDTVDVYDTRTERSVHIIGGDLPMVGGRQVISPNGDIVLLDAHNACERSYYDQIGCKSAPGREYHVWRASDRKTVLSRSFDPTAGIAASFFPDGNRIFFAGGVTMVWDWARNMVLERLPLASVNAALAPAGDRAFFTTRETPEILVFDAEKESCLPPPDGLMNFYFADGTLDDSIAVASFTGGPVEFAPGRFGQAFRFDGKASSLQARTGSAWCPSCAQQWSVSLFVKFESLDGDMTVLGIPDHPGGWNLRLFKSRGNRIVLDGGGAGLSIETATVVQAGRWYHVAIAAGHDRWSLFVNGVLQGQNSSEFPIRVSGVEDGNVFLGSNRGERDFLHGLIDEVAVYNRELSSREVMMLSEPCSVPSR